MSSRRSARKRGHDEDSQVVAPGFGTRQDIAKLSQDLSAENEASLPEAAVEAMMNSRGRGIMSPTTGKTKPGATSSAWADFMKEEGVDLPGFSATAASKSHDSDHDEDNNDNNTRRANQSSSGNNKSSTSLAHGQQRDYLLDGLTFQEPSWLQVAGSTAKKSKTSDANKTKPGELLQTGTLDATVVGRAKVTLEANQYHLQIPTRILPSIKITKVFTGCNSVHSIALDQHGQAYGWGRNDQGALGNSLPTNVPLPTLLEGLADTPIVSAALGKGHTLVLTSEGSVLAVGNNKCGQCGVKSSIETINEFKPCVFAATAAGSDPKIVQITCGEQFSVALTEEGQVFTTGASEFGQLGNGETGEYFVTASKLAFANCQLFTLRNQFMATAAAKAGSSSSSNEKLVRINEDIRIQAIACGKHHTLAVEADYHVEDGDHARLRVFSWGCGDYGCLGHGVQADEYFPREIAALGTHVWMPPGPLKVAAGAHCSLIQTVNGHVYYWGKHRSVGEAVMRPQLVEALANNQHVVTHCAAGGQTVVCSTSGAQTVAWGQGPHGELGLGKAKSSAKPTFVDALTGCRVQDLACGYGHTLFIATDEDAEDKAAIAKLEAVNPEAIVEELSTAWAAAAASSGAKATKKKKK